MAISSALRLPLTVAKVFLYTLALFLLLFLTLELCAQWFGVPSPYVTDPVLGWRSKKNFHFTYSQRDESGASYLAELRTDAEGRRTFGVDNPQALKILVLGDSFTADPYAGNQEMWYALAAGEISQHLHRDVFVAAAGAGGYGSLQELLLATELSRSFTPELVVLQFCANDFSNNHMGLETSGIVRGQFMRRPYASATGIQYYQHPLAFLYRHSPLAESKVFNKADGLIQGLQFRYYGGYGPTLPAELQARYEAESLAITKDLLTKLRAQFAKSAAFMVNCSGEAQGLNARWQELAHEAGFTPVPEASDAVLRAKKSGSVVFNADKGHLNPLGNAIFGKALAGAALPSLKKAEKH